MRRILFILICLAAANLTQAQELNCTIAINAEQTGQPNLQVFRTLETQLNEFVNNTKWTDKTYNAQERIDCNMSLVITNLDGETFTGTLQVQSSRPVFDSTYDRPVYNYFDRQVSFKYKEYDPLNININSAESILVYIISFHIYTVLGLDAGTYALNGGEPYFQIAKQITNTAAGTNYMGWKSKDGNQSRYQYNNALLSSVYKEFHQAMYDYHRNGMDLMASDPKKAKENIVASISLLKGINDRRPNAFLLRTFFDAKGDEIQAIYSGGPQVDIVQLVENLNRMAPTKRSNWQEIKF